MVNGRNHSLDASDIVCLCVDLAISNGMVDILSPEVDFLVCDDLGVDVVFDIRHGRCHCDVAGHGLDLGLCLGVVDGVGLLHRDCRWDSHGLGHCNVDC